MLDPIHNAYVRGDAAQLRRLVGPDFWQTPSRMAPIPLEYAIYHSPLGFIAEMIELGADPNYEDPAGFPSLIAALTTDRSDLSELIGLLLDRGADIEERGVNGYTALHYAAAHKTVESVELLLARGADPSARTHVDDHNTPEEEAMLLGRTDTAQVLANHRT